MKEENRIRISLLSIKLPLAINTCLMPVIVSGTHCWFGLGANAAVLCSILAAILFYRLNELHSKSADAIIELVGTDS